MNNKLRWFIPPIVPLAARKMAEALRPRKATPVDDSEAVEKLRWCPIESGPLVGRSLYMNPEAQSYQTTMLQGTFDQFLFDYIDRTNWSGKVIYDIGAHIGYHTLNFAHRVGVEGRVFSFEPHPLHLERIKVNLSRNADLAARVTLVPVAVGNNAGRLALFCTESVEGGGSSASFIEGASTPFPRSNYSQYHAIEVETARLDDLVSAGRCLPPDLVKIDVEGAESLVIETALATLRKYKPIILMEVHSLPNMLRVTTLLLSLGYSFNLLEEEDRRCFVAVEPSDTKAEPYGRP
jgi:FkbM family methyltransferase